MTTMPRVDDVLRELGPALARVASSYEVDPSRREDLIQDIVFAVCRSIPRLRDPDRLRPFVFRIAHNQGMRYLLKRSRGALSLETAEAVESGEANPEERLLQADSSRRLLEAVRQLPLGHRQVITLVLEDLTYVEIAEALGLTLSNVGVRVTRAKKQLKGFLTNE